MAVTRTALVVGGGIAGMSAALAIADEGFDVCLVEKEARLGGNALEIHKSVGGEDVQAKLKEFEARLCGHPRIRVLTGARIKTIEGFVGNYKTTIAQSDSSDPSHQSDVQVAHGVVVVATGAQYRTPTEYHYGESPSIITQRELEERIAAVQRSSGPAAKRPTSALDHLATRPLDHSSPRSVVMIQCVGSRDDERPYCSRICCAEAVKNAIALKEFNPDTDVYVLYRDIRTYGMREEYYRKARESGVVFIRYSQDEKPDVSLEDGKPVVLVRDPILDRKLELRPDLLVLSSGVVPQTGSDELAKMLKVPLNQDGFFLEAHMKLRPVDFATEGVFMAGLCHFPKFIDESIAQARAAASRAATILSRDHIESEATVAHIDSSRCTACRMCETLCAYRAIEVKTVNETFGIQAAVVNEALCKGCGACVASCRCSALDLRGFTSENISREIAALLDR